MEEQEDIMIIEERGDARKSQKHQDGSSKVNLESVSLKEGHVVMRKIHVVADVVDHDNVPESEPQERTRTSVYRGTRGGDGHGDLSIPMDDIGSTVAEYMRFNGVQGRLIPVADVACSEVVEAVPVHHGECRARTKERPRWKIDEKVWVQKPLCCDVGVNASNVVSMNSGVQAVSYTTDSDQDGDSNVQKTVPISKALTQLGKILFQNSTVDAYQDLFQWNDPVDDCQATHGSLLPLWEAVCCWDGDENGALFSAVTCFCWHPCKKNEDVFALGLGSMDYMDGSVGCACIYSVFDMHFPQHRILTDVGITCISFSPDGQHLAIGLQDGGLEVWSMHTVDSSSLVKSDIRTHHLFPVWGIRWETSHGLVSVSQDGLEGVWEFDPTCRTLVRIGSQIIGMSDSYHTYDPYVFLQNRIESDNALNMVCCTALCDTLLTQTEMQPVVYGTLEGEILSCFRGAGTILKKKYHHAPVYSISVNPFDSRYIMAASLDWSVSIWNSSSLDEVLLDVDVGEPIIDAQWSMQSSTVFAVATETGNVYVYDLSVSKEVPLCQQRVCGSGSLTFVRFHPRHPIVFVGTADGRVLCLKLSPNLRCKKANDDAVDFAFLDDDMQGGAQVERPILGLEEQLEALHEALAHPF